MGTKTRHLIEAGRIIAVVMKFGVTVVGLIALFLLCVTLPVALPLALLALITDGFSPEPPAWLFLVAVILGGCGMVWGVNLFGRIEKSLLSGK